MRKREGLAIIQFWKTIIDNHQGLIDLETVVEWMFPESIGIYESVAWVEPPSPTLVLSKHQHESFCYSAIIEPATNEPWCDVYERDQDGVRRYAFRHATLHMLVYEWSLLYSVDFEVFRPYGFSIWDGKRIMAWELWDVSSQKNSTRILDSKIWFTWRSILSKKQVEELERKLAKNVSRYSCEGIA